jgi:anti-sigma factor RsiW
VEKVLRRHPSLKDLSEYASAQPDNLRRGELAEHIRSCRRCAKKIESFRRFDSLVQSSLVALDSKAAPPGGATPGCLPPIVLANYLDDLLSPEQRAGAEEHLADCPACREHLLQIRRALEEQEEEGFAGPDRDTREKALGLIKSTLPPARVRCPVCNEENARGVSACSSCGAQLKPATVALLCISCRQPIPAASRFCPTCGAVIAPPRKSLGFLFARRRSPAEIIRAHVWLAAGLGAIGISFFTHRYFMQFIALGLIFGAKWILDQAQFRIYNEILKSLRKEAESDRERRRRAGGGR